MLKFRILKNRFFLSLLAVVSFSAQVRADGFVCDATHESLRIQVYNRTHPRDGTRNVAVMVLSDPSKVRGERTLMRFDADNDELSNHGAIYTAWVEPEIETLLDRRVQGIQLGQLREIVLRVDFSYRYPIGHKTLVPGVLELYQLNGDQLWVDLDCRRYLKGSKKP